MSSEVLVFYYIIKWLMRSSAILHRTNFMHMTTYVYQRIDILYIQFTIMTERSWLQHYLPSYMGKTLKDLVIPLKVQAWANKTILTPPLFIEVSVPLWSLNNTSKELCVVWVSFCVCFYDFIGGISALLLRCGIFCFSYQYYWSNQLYLKFPCNGIHIQYWITGISVTIVIHGYLPWYTCDKWTKRKKIDMLDSILFYYPHSVHHYVTKLSVTGGRSV